MKKICIIGTGYVGLVTGACFAELGHRVVCVDINVARVAALREGVVPFYEPDLDGLVHQHLASHSLSVTTALGEGVTGADFVFVSVGTPSTADNKEVDLGDLHLAYLNLSSALNGTRPIIINKSTVPPGTSDMMAALMARVLNGSPHPTVVSNPEFLREGHAVFDFMNPGRVVIGAGDLHAAKEVADLYRPLDSPILMTDTRTAEMIKLASNAFLAMKVSFINEMASICDPIGVDVGVLSEGLGLDHRIGKDFLRAGPGYGGGCLPKDIAMLSRFSLAQGHHAALIDAAIEVNDQQPGRLVDHLAEMMGTLQGTTIALLGLSFKAQTDDVRNSPALAMLRQIRSEGARVKAYDPKANASARRLVPEVEYAADPYQCAKGCDAVVIGTEWPEFGAMDLRRMKEAMRGSVLLDGRNVIDPESARKAGFMYRGVGRPSRVTVVAEDQSYAHVLLD